MNTLTRPPVGAPVAASSERSITDLEGADRDRALPILRESFEGYYRWHAKRTLRDIPRVRGLEEGGMLQGAALLEMLLPEVGYVFYIFSGAAFRRRGVGGALLDDALAWFRGKGAWVVYAAAEEDNEASLRLFRSRGFRVVERKETSWKEGGLGAWGLRSRMHIVYGEVLMGLDLRTPLSGARVGSSPPL